VELPVERAIPVGLIVNELVTNSFKHAFNERQKGTIGVSLRRGQAYRLAVEDNGKGCSKAEAAGLGSRLVELLVRQLNGSMDRSDAAAGCRVQIQFPERA
jgi:two-component sensor histidine kinase